MSADDDTAWDGDLVDLLTLERQSTDSFVSRQNEPNSGGEIFGGQYLGQAVFAASCVGGGRAPHAMTGYFLRAADAAHALFFTAELIREGRSFAHVRVTASQHGTTTFCADVSLHDEEPDAPSHARVGPEVPSPAQCSSLSELLERYGDALGPLAQRLIGRKDIVEMRLVDPVGGILAPASTSGTSVWLRVMRLGSADRLMRYAALAYLSDYWANSSCRIPHTRTMFSGELSSTSLNHGIWFHRTPDVTSPLLYVLDSPSTHGGTGFNRGLVYQQDGKLVASTVQEALVRRSRGSAGSA